MNSGIEFNFLHKKEFLRYKKEKIFLKLREQIREIAIYKGGGGLGDLVVGTPFFRLLKQTFPEAKLNYMGIIYPRFKNIFESIPCLDGYIHYERPDKGRRMKKYFDFRRKWKGKIDLLIDTQRRWETSFWLKFLGPRYILSASPFLSTWPVPLLDYKSMHILEQMFSLLARLGIQDFSDLDYRLEIAEEFKENARKLLSLYSSSASKYVALLPSCGMEYKNWLPEYFAKLGDLFANCGYIIIILGSPKERDLFKKIAARMHRKPIIPAEIDNSLAEELMNDAAILEHCEFAVGNDSGGMHLASCLGLFTGTIFGPTTPRKFSPIGPHSIIFYKHFPCSPCRFKCTRKIHKECLVSITPDEVFFRCSEGVKNLRKTNGEKTSD